MITAKEIFTQEAIDSAYSWLCRSRRHFPPNSDVWHIRFHWHELRKPLLNDLLKERYALSPQKYILSKEGKVIHLWSSMDAIVLKVLSVALAGRLRLSCNCTHLKGHGGAKVTVNKVADALPEYNFVMKTDVYHYYESISHERLMDKLSPIIQDKFIWRLLYGYIKRSIDCGGNIKTPDKGISRGCSLSPVIAAFYLSELDDCFDEQGHVFYLRYMDDIIVLAKTRWSLKRAVKTVNQCLSVNGLTQAPDKTFIGRIDKGFDFLGYHFNRDSLGISEKTMRNMQDKWQRLYEQKKTASSNENAVHLAAYWRRWCSWAKGGLSIKRKARMQDAINEQLSVFLMQPSRQYLPTTSR